jgi:hypothetical protein
MPVSRVRVPPLLCAGHVTGRRVAAGRAFGRAGRRARWRVRFRLQVVRAVARSTSGGSDVPRGPLAASWGPRGNLLVVSLGRNIGVGSRPAAKPSRRAVGGRSRRRADGLPAGAGAAARGHPGVGRGRRVLRRHRRPCGHRGADPGRRPAPAAHRRGRRAGRPVRPRHGDPPGVARRRRPRGVGPTLVVSVTYVGSQRRRNTGELGLLRRRNIGDVGPRDPLRRRDGAAVVTCCGIIC